MTTSEAVQAYLDYKSFFRRVSPTSLGTYRAHLRRFTKAVGRDRQLSRAADLARDFIVAMSKRGRSDNYVRKAFFVVRDLLIHAKSEGWIKANPLDGLAPPILHAKPKVFITEEGIESFLAAVRSSHRRLSRRDHALFATLYYSWLRVTEACRSRPEDFDLEKATLRVYGKGGKELLIPFAPQLVPILRAYLRAHRPAPSGFMFPSQQHPGGPCGVLERVRVAYLMREVYGAPAGLVRGATPHALRRSGGDHARRRGAELRDIQGIYRHAQITTTMGYLGKDHERVHLISALFHCQLLFTKRSILRRDLMH